MDTSGDIFTYCNNLEKLCIRQEKKCNNMNRSNLVFRLKTVIVKISVESVQMSLYIRYETTNRSKEV
jgi:hypothetical protein